MSAGGDGIVGVEPLVEVALPAGVDAPFIPRRFRAGGRLNVQDSPNIQSTRLVTCVLCGGVIADGDSTLEHPLPQWLHRFAGDVGGKSARSFVVGSKESTWRQLCLDAHRKCNTEFGRRIENPTINSLKAIVEGKTLTWSQVDAVFDWLDKVKSSTAHMGIALQGHRTRLGYDNLSFPNVRTGAFDRLALFFRISDTTSSLDLWECLNEGFLTTPSAIALRIKDLVIVYASNNYLLSKAFGLGFGVPKDGKPTFVNGTGVFASGFGSRVTRLPAAKIIAQPMRRQHLKEGFHPSSDALQENGDGKIYELEGMRWSRVRSTSFSRLPKLRYQIGYALAGLEVVEWIILSKEQDYSRYGSENSFFMKSMPNLLAEKTLLLDLVASLRGGLRPQQDDRDVG
ncbi:hypothetical protein [Bradyrhizobium sp. CCGUVB23]|uniref:hypothetical protein n=1 Tax=Bradyrhizobium sp. CCGUVB23 TaxID=2949630 RepID=UPI0020B25BAF|nr:hypothetical protein [Bradyrhizobium sp. CCGUVB23]MCP3466998.1 hypothetical protein [Bradyrhizobium sp. CCGUVB23]